LWNQEGAFIEVEILPPWWQTKIAVLTYIALFILLIYFLLKQYKRRTDEKHTEKQKIFEVEKEKELYDSKVDFFTNIAHEIRTPVTLINGPLEVMQEMNLQDTEIVKNLHIMRRNTSELMELVNKLLDFRKVDSNKFPMNISVHNLSEILRTIYDRFEPTFAHLNKSITLSLPADDIFSPMDKEAFTKIINNLLSNALRYSEHIIKVDLIQQEESVFIRVRNDGNLIPEEEREKIFDPFYQVNKHRNSAAGSGIGLSLARSLTEMLNGNLSYTEQEGMNEFILQLPLKLEETEKEEVPEADYILMENENEDVQENPNAEIILIVEDNEEILSFIAKQLRKKFAVEKALEGKEALKILEEKTISLVLSDIMMPEMNGFELCKHIKNNLDYSHIPVVLLTAKNDLKSKIQGLEAGADAYVEKPFSISHLITQLTTLLNNRRREKEAFMRKPFLPIQHIGMNKADEQFIRNVIDIIQENITDSDFNVERLSESVFMSRSNLHRKIKALTELSPTDFIRLIRLRKAAELIQSGEYRIGEVCYLVGINSSSYFIKLFQKQFGVTPKEFAKQL
jgi:signal transduction histidine kinase/DNA-binding response OmpR family regulator